MYKASIAKMHQLLGLADPTKETLVKLRLTAIKRRMGTAQTTAWVDNAPEEESSDQTGSDYTLI